MNVEDIYTPIEEAGKILQERWNNVELRKKVSDFLNGDIPDLMETTPHTCMVRHLASPDAEFRRFLELSDKVGLSPICLEYLQDKFVSNNEDKYYFGRMLFDFGVGKKGGRRLDPINIIDFNTSNGKRFCDLKTLWNENFVDFHHKLLNESVPNRVEIQDFSEWFKRNGGSANKYYEKYLSLFVCYGILFENFLLSGEEAELTKNLVINNIEKIKEKFGYTPIIVKVDDTSEGDQYWYSYQDFLKKIVYDKINKRYV